MLINVKIDIHCNRPIWAMTGYDVKYRVYVDNTLITERTWVWNNTTYIQENIWVNTNILDHILKIDPIISTKSIAKFYLNNLQTTTQNGVSCLNTAIHNDLEILFKTYKYTIPRENYEKYRIFKRRV
jgi:hypothetical protein